MPGKILNQFDSL